jgi:hypothetical protein
LDYYLAPKLFKSANIVIMILITFYKVESALNCYDRCGDGSERPFMLLNHTDVVPVEREYWEEDPFGGLVKEPRKFVAPVAPAPVEPAPVAPAPRREVAPARLAADDLDGLAALQAAESSLSCVSRQVRMAPLLMQVGVERMRSSLNRTDRLPSVAATKPRSCNMRP